MHCTQCGAANAGNSLFCVQCGVALKSGAVVSAPAPKVYAGFWIRGGAYLIDYVILTIAGFIAMFLLGLADRAHRPRGVFPAGRHTRGDRNSRVPGFHDPRAGRRRNGAGVQAEDSRYVESFHISNGTITIVYGRNANAQIRNATLALRPYVDRDGDVVWQCGRAPRPDGTYINSGGESGEGTDSDPGETDLDDRYLPESFRSASG